MTSRGIATLMIIKFIKKQGTWRTSDQSFLHYPKLNAVRQQRECKITHTIGLTEPLGSYNPAMPLIKYTLYSLA